MNTILLLTINTNQFIQNQTNSHVFLGLGLPFCSYFGPLSRSRPVCPSLIPSLSCSVPFSFVRSHFHAAYFTFPPPASTLQLTFYMRTISHRPKTIRMICRCNLQFEKINFAFVCKMFPPLVISILYLIHSLHSHRT